MNETIEFTSPHRGHLEERKARVLKLAAADAELSATQLAQRFGVSRSHVANWLREAGLSRGRGWKGAAQ